MIIVTSAISEALFSKMFSFHTKALSQSLSFGLKSVLTFRKAPFAIRISVDESANQRNKAVFRIAPAWRRRGVNQKFSIGVIHSGFRLIHS